MRKNYSMNYKRSDSQGKSYEKYALKFLNAYIF